MFILAMDVNIINLRSQPHLPGIYAVRNANIVMYFMISVQSIVWCNIDYNNKPQITL